MQRVKLLLWLLLCCHVVCALSRANQSKLKPPWQRAFSRKKRALIFPPGSFVKFTGSVGKGLLSSYPRGINFVFEEAVYFPIPGSRADLYPKRFKPKTTTPKPMPSAAPSYVYIPGTDWRFKAQTVAKPKPQPLLTQPLDVEPASSYANPYKWQQWQQYGQKYAQQYGAQYAQKVEQKYDNFPATKAHWQKWTTSAPKWQHWRQQRVNRATTAAQLPTNWRHYHAHRDRRNLFDHFSSFSELFGLDVKSCIMRTICDSKRLLLPQGYSMLQDMLRLVFTMPRLDGLTDDYSRIMSQDAAACALELKSKCNMSLLIWLLSGRVA